MYSMRKILLFIAVIVLTGCYDDYVQDYDYNAIYFPFQTDVRTVVVGEGMQFRQGITLGGVIENIQDREIYYELDNSLVSPSTLDAMKNHAFSYVKALAPSIPQLEELPANEYELLFDGQPANGKIVMRKGEHVAFVTVKIDSAAFLARTDRTSPYSVIPFRLVKAEADLILENKETVAVGVMYENMLFGNYWHGGKTLVKKGDGTEEVITYYTKIPQSEDLVWKLTTVAPFELTVNGVSGEIASKTPQFKLKLNHDGKIDITPVDGAKYQVEAHGDSYFNNEKYIQNRKIYLNYKYRHDGNEYVATDTLTFRNRIRDGINEWQDERGY